MPRFTRRRLLSGFAALGTVAGVFGLRSASARYYDGPVSDHFDGARFFDLNGPAQKQFAFNCGWIAEDIDRSRPQGPLIPTGARHLLASGATEYRVTFSVLEAL